MNPLACPLLADENIHADVIEALVEQGKDVRSVHDLLLRHDARRPGGRDEAA